MARTATALNESYHTRNVGRFTRALLPGLRGHPFPPLERTSKPAHVRAHISPPGIRAWRRR